MVHKHGISDDHITIRMQRHATTCTRWFRHRTVEQAKVVLEAWRNIDATLKIGDLEMAALETGLAQANTFYGQIESLEALLTNARNQRDAQLKHMWEMVKRVRAGVKSIYGDDSSQYEMVGGTRLSERKPNTQKK